MIFSKKEPRKPETKITQFYMDLASSIQNVTEEILLKILKSFRSEYNFQNLCLAGGVALNCVANGKLLDSKLLKKFGFSQRLEMLEEQLELL